MEPISDVLYKAKKIHDEHGIVIVTIVDWNHLAEIQSPYSHLNDPEKSILLDQTLYIVESASLLPHLHHLPHTVLERHGEQNLTLSQQDTELYLLQILITFTQHQLKVLTLPTTCKTITNNLKAQWGQRCYQTVPTSFSQARQRSTNMLRLM